MVLFFMNSCTKYKFYLKVQHAVHIKIQSDTINPYLIFSNHAENLHLKSLKNLVFFPTKYFLGSPIHINIDDSLII